MASTPALSSEALRAYILHSLLYFPSIGKLIPCLSIAPVYNLGIKGLGFYPTEPGLQVVHRNVHRKLMFVLHQVQGLLHKLQEYYLQFHLLIVVRFNTFLDIIDIIKSALSRRFDGDAVVLGSFKILKIL
jgi:hypothetical protein